MSGLEEKRREKGESQKEGHGTQLHGKRQHLPWCFAFSSSAPLAG